VIAVEGGSSGRETEGDQGAHGQPAFRQATVEAARERGRDVDPHQKESEREDENSR
jgi:hypothetical protein